MRTRRCSLCRKKIEAGSAIIGSLRAFCCIEHLVEYSRSATAQKMVSREKRKETKKRKEGLKTNSERTKDAQKAFNRFVRIRDAGKPCVCCGRSQGDLKHGGAVDAGHYRSRGSAPNLKFNLFNCHSQLAYCNRYQSGNVIGYRNGLIDRIGLDRIERLEADNSPRKFDAEYLDRVKKIFTKRAKLYERLFR